jgi:O-antigen/teichoic acid export membrane protein
MRPVLASQDPGAPSASADGQRLPSRSRRAILTTVDQGIFSVSNFAVAVAIAHISGVAGLGSYSLAYALWLVFQTLHRGLITDPMAIENEARHPQAGRYLTAGLASELLLGLMAALFVGLLGLALFVSGQHEFGVCMLALAPWLPVLLAQDYWRWIGFMQARPGKALANDVVFDCVQAVVFTGLVVMGIRSPVVAIGAWGAGAAAGALFGLRQFAVRLTLRGGWAKLRWHWPISRWLSVNGVTSWGSSQSNAILTAAILGPVGVGGLRAAQTLVNGVSLVLLQSGSSLGLPEASRGLAEGGWAGIRNVTRFITTAAVVAVGLITVVVLVDGALLMRFFYGPKFGRYSTAATVIAFSALVNAIALGAVLTLKATRQTRVLFVIGVAQMVTMVVALATLAPIWGVTGAAIGVGAGSVVSTVALLSSQRRTFRSAPANFAHGRSPAPGEVAPSAVPAGAMGGVRAALVGEETLWARGTAPEDQVLRVASGVWR